MLKILKSEDKEKLRDYFGLYFWPFSKKKLAIKMESKLGKMLVESQSSCYLQPFHDGKSSCISISV